MRVRNALFALILGVIAVPSANAAVMNFDGANGNPDPWVENDFIFSPVKTSNDTKCWGGRCLQEITQGEVTTMTYDAPVADATPDPFNLDFFYFSLLGNTPHGDNVLTVIGTFADATKISATFFLDDLLGTVLTDATTSVAKLHGGETNNTQIKKQSGYWVDFGDSWNNLISVDWTGNTLANGEIVYGRNGSVRIDCVGANESVTGANSGCNPITVATVPIPAAGLLLLGALGGLGFAGRRRRKI
ncbi:VPLPA-CTERM sorting domain-containing protein [uncultured Shimia sp.]|uniref:VPLPA-CTERM sorting domain-containing protein n=1 Tax=uncultured Shimia sp. TaxID=573152 RepID=UPI002621AC2B|nr:VPLPA-CTERM sorting domain-containing protein [uncultured Shimia sp.]